MTTQQPQQTIVNAISISSTLLRNELSRLAPFVTNQPIVPILENALLTTDANQLSIYVSDLQISKTVRIPCECEVGLRICIPIKKIIKFLSTISEQPISLSVDENTFKITINTQEPFGEYTFSGENPIDFPKLPSFEPSYSFMIPITQLRDILRTVKGYMGRDDLRPAMTGMYWGFHVDAAMQSWHEIAATDGHRLLKLTPDIASAVTGPQGFESIWPGDLVRRLAILFPKKGDDIKIELTNYNIRLSWGHYSITSRLVDEKFPDYNNGAIPTVNPVQVQVNRMALIGAIRRALVFANPTTHQMKLTVKRNMYDGTGLYGSVHAENLDYADEMKETIKFIHNEGPGIVIGFNAKIMLEVLQSISTPTIELRMSQPSRAVLIHPIIDKEADENFTSLIMPVMIWETVNYGRY